VSFSAPTGAAQASTHSGTTPITHGTSRGNRQRTLRYHQRFRQARRAIRSRLRLSSRNLWTPDVGKVSPEAQGVPGSPGGWPGPIGCKSGNPTISGAMPEAGVVVAGVEGRRGGCLCLDGLGDASHVHGARMPRAARIIESPYLTKPMSEIGFVF
jgi:hypothetical protein